MSTLRHRTLGCLLGCVSLPLFLFVTFDLNIVLGLMPCKLCACSPSQELTFQMPVPLGHMLFPPFPVPLEYFFAYSDAFCLTVIVRSGGH